jgi:flotillin
MDISESAILSLAVVAVAAVCVGVVTVLFVRRTLHVSAPNELLVISGRRHRRPDGTIVGYRVVRGGRAVVVPFLETVARLELTSLAVQLAVEDLVVRGGGRAGVSAFAAVKIASEEPLLHHAVERFMGLAREQIREVAAKTLEGCLRTIAARFDAAGLRHDASRVEEALRREAQGDLDRLGLTLDTFKVQEVRAESAGYRGNA